MEGPLLILDLRLPLASAVSAYRLDCAEPFFCCCCGLVCVGRSQTWLGICISSSRRLVVFCLSVFNAATLSICYSCDLGNLQCFAAFVCLTDFRHRVSELYRPHSEVRITLTLPALDIHSSLDTACVIDWAISDTTCRKLPAGP